MQWRLLQRLRSAAAERFECGQGEPTGEAIAEGRSTERANQTIGRGLAGDEHYPAGNLTVPQLFEDFIDLSQRTGGCLATDLSGRRHRKDLT
jgi:hypothetical protein